MKKISILLAVLSLFACEKTGNIANDKDVVGKCQALSHPLYVMQDIDNINPCDIVLPGWIKIIKMPGSESYTAAYIDAGLMWYKVDKKTTNLDFDFRPSNPKFYSDTCQLKEELRPFVKLKITHYIMANFK